MFKYGEKRIRKVGLLGLGKSNLGVYSYLSRHFPTLSFTVRADKLSDGVPEWAERLLIGDRAFSDIDEDILFLSPSVRRDCPVLTDAVAREVMLSSDAEFFFQHNESDVYAVTGSDGKSTTVYLTSRLLLGGYRSALPLGNFGEAMTPHLDDAPGYATVAELSSFQLNYLKPKSVRCAITNLTPNHLNWHKSFSEYAGAKANILPGAKETVLNYDCPESRKLFAKTRPYAVISRRLSLRALVREVSAEIYVYEREGRIYINGEPMLDTKKIRAFSDYNVSNFACAMALAYGKYDKELLYGIAEGFGGLPHRCELVGEKDGVRYYDSSIDSSPKRCAATLSRFSGNVILILGGRSKGLDFSELVPPLLRVARKIIITGECADEIEAALLRDTDFLRSGIKYLKIQDFFDAVGAATDSAVSGDAVLLSPAATSFDRFKSFEERGDAFKSFLKTKGI
ncbi:MAG: UDP-N-acetylmuramoyl-L-alanine--D-glutamate ligase [Clostridia bacterium]|nr:UDP-N-acetylmuramoyl-L-alanine--D-glutamate ligase [Clostridia bacterium]